MVFGTLIDPALDDVDLLLSEGHPIFRRRHEIDLVIGDETIKEFTVFGIARNDTVVIPQIGRGVLEGIDAEIGFLVLGIGAMALETPV